jgi:predicted GNAT family acetyltransferase
VIAVTNRPELGRYEISSDGELAGFVVYELRGPSVAVMHTEIDDRYEGQGLGSRLVAAALDDIRAQGSSVLPFCPFARSFIASHPEYLELVPEARRHEFGL